MIKSFGDKETQRIFEGERIRTLHSDIQERALRRLVQIHRAVSLDDLRHPLRITLRDFAGNSTSITPSESTNNGASSSFGREWTPRTFPSSITTDMNSNPNTDTPLLHNFAAGLLGDFLEDYELSQRGLASALHVPAQRINDVLAGRRLITPDMALRLGRYFGNRPEYWLALQDEWLLRKAKLENAEEISSIHPLATA